MSASYYEVISKICYFPRQNSKYNFLFTYFRLSNILFVKLLTSNPESKYVFFQISTFLHKWSRLSCESVLAVLAGFSDYRFLFFSFIFFLVFSFRFSCPPFFFAVKQPDFLMYGLAFVSSSMIPQILEKKIRKR